MNQKTRSAYLFVVAFFVLAGFASLVTIAKNDNASEKSTKSEKTEKVSQSDVNGGVVNLKDYKKPDTSKGETNAKIHKEKTTEVLVNLVQVEMQEESTDVTNEVQEEAKIKAKKQIREVVEEKEASQDEVADAIEEIESDSPAKKFFLGADYKNLGQLRSELVQNRNQIRKLTQAIDDLAQGGESVTSLQTQLQTLTQERERIKNIIVANQEGFSLFGWVSRFLNNYEETPVNEDEEAALVEEVEEAIEIANPEVIEPVVAPANEETTTETAPTTTPATEITTPDTANPEVIVVP